MARRAAVGRIGGFVVNAGCIENPDIGVFIGIFGAYGFCGPIRTGRSQSWSDGTSILILIKGIFIV